MTTQQLITLAQQLESELRAAHVTLSTTAPHHAPILLQQATHAAGIVEALQCMVQLRTVEKIVSPDMRAKLSRLGTTEEEFRVIEKLQEKLKGQPEEQEYRMLEEGEIIQAGDECISPGNSDWTPVQYTVGQPVIPGCADLFRRPVTHPAPQQEYRLLEVGEQVQAGDESSRNGLAPWVPCEYTVGLVIRDHWEDHFRRPVTRPAPQQEYRMLEENEALQKGDEVQDNDGKWHPTGLVGKKPLWSLRYRRPIITAEQFQPVIDFHQRECSGEQDGKEVKS